MVYCSVDSEQSLQLGGKGTTIETSGEEDASSRLYGRIFVAPKQKEASTPRIEPSGLWDFRGFVSFCDFRASGVKPANERSDCLSKKTRRKADQLQ